MWKGSDIRPFSDTARLSFVYLTSYAVYGAFLPFLPIILHQAGLADSETAFAMSASGIAATLAPLVFGHISDRLKDPRVLMVGLLIVSTGLINLFHYCHTPGLAFSAQFLVNFFYLPFIAFLDPYTLGYLRSVSADNSKPVHHHRIRVWGSIGFMIPALCLIPINVFFKVNPSILIFVSTMIGIVASLCALALPYVGRVGEISKLPSIDALKAAWSKRVRHFFIAAFICGLGMSMLYVILPRFLEESGCSIVQIGLISSLGVLAEVILIPFGQRLVERFGANTLILIGMLALVVRMTMVGFGAPVWLVITLQLLHAPMIVAFFVAVPAMLSHHFSDSIRFSIMGCYSVIVSGITRVLGPWILAGVLGASSGDTISALQTGALTAAGFALAGAAWMFFKAERL